MSCHRLHSLDGFWERQVSGTRALVLSLAASEILRDQSDLLGSDIPP